MPAFDPALESAALALLEEALERPAGRRRAWAAEQAAADDRLRARVDQLLDAAEDADGLHTGAATETALDPLPPERVGAYRIVERLGQGGMGAVYRAERDAGDFSHAVAVKVIRPGVLSPEAVQRFERERQILADLAHPNIARLFDGGRTANGQPFIVMELVAGRPVTAWVRAQRLPLTARLELFLSICDAVAHAHQKLVIHRDLTPGNVLVTEDGTVKLIDFGIARPPEAEPPPGAAGSLAGLSLTPGFAAPERQTGAGASTLIDIYSLGRLMEAIAADLPPRPELAAVVARAAATAPEARYPSVDALGDDVRRFLTGRPVLARGGGRAYAFSKFVRRHVRVFAAGTGAFVLLVAALAATLAAYGSAVRAREAEARRFEDLRRLASYMLFELNPRLSRVPGNTRPRAELAAQAQLYLSALAGSARAEPALRLDAARGLIALAEVQGVPAQPNLGEVEPARANLARALQLLAGRPAGEAVPERARALAAQAVIAMNIDASQAGADRLLGQAEAALAAASPTARGDPWLLARRTVRRAELEAAVLAQRPEALKTLSAALEAEVRGWPARLQGTREAALDQAYVHQYRATRAYFVDAFAEGVAEAQAAERRLRAMDAKLPNDPETLYALAWTSYTGWGAASGLPSARATAEGFVDLARTTVTRLLAIEENDQSLKSFAAQIAQAQSQTLSAAGRHREAVAAQADAVRLVSAAAGPARRPAVLNRLALAEVTLSVIAARAGDRALTCAALGRADGLVKELRRAGRLLGSVASYETRLDVNLALCAAGAPLSRFRSLDQG